MDADGGIAGDDPTREVITTANATIVVTDPAESVDELAALVEDAGGRVDERVVRSDTEAGGSPPSAAMTLRVPAEELETLLTELAGFGQVQELSQEAEDVTQAARDLDARIAALETSTDRLLEIIADADNSADLIAAEEALSQRQAELESLQSQREYLSDQVAMSTVRVDLIARDDPSVEAGGFLGGLASGWRALVTFANGLLVFTGVALPWLVLLGIPALIVVVLVRRRRRNRSPRQAATHTPAQQVHPQQQSTHGQHGSHGQSNPPGQPAAQGPSNAPAQTDSPERAEPPADPT